MKKCKKHNQEYMDHLDECPICTGESYYKDIPLCSKHDFKEVKNSKTIKSLCPVCGERVEWPNGGSS